jgi:hypothetical protein
VGEMHDLFESHGGEDAYIRAISSDEDLRSWSYEKTKQGEQSEKRVLRQMAARTQNKISLK